jgi:DHA1 family tetracycline resistance protein-like MFS transporter
LKNHTLITTLKNLRGNPRGCVYTEPLWGIPYNLYIPYVSIYMLAIGLSDKQIGLIASVGAGFQVILALLSGVITDKLGRRRTTLIFDIIAWGVPSLISALAQNFWYFLAAAIINSIWRITHNSWSCLLVEDAEPEQLADIYSWIYIANLIVGFIAPLAGLLIATFTLIPTMRGLYIFATIMFTIKAIVTYQMTEETAQGKVRMHETKHQNSLAILSEYQHVLREILRTPQTLYTAGIMLVFSISTLITGNFWAIIVTQKLLIPNDGLWLFTFVKSVVMILFFFVVMPRISAMHFKIPMVAGFVGFIVSQFVLIAAPAQGYGLLLLSVFLEAFSLATVSPLLDRMTVLTIEPKERARILSILYVGIILFTSPFGWIAGMLSSLNKDLPFILNIVLFTVGALLAYLAGQASIKTIAIEEIPVEVR